MIFYTVESDEFRFYIEAIVTSLFPRYYKRNELIFEQDDSFKETLFIMEGNYKIGLFDFIDLNNPKKNWYQF